MFIFKETISDYTEGEFVDFLEEFTNPTKNGEPLMGAELEKYTDILLNHFIKITEHPAQGDLLFYPEKPGDDESENILKIVKEWRRSQGLPLFKDSK